MRTGAAQQHCGLYGECVSALSGEAGALAVEVPMLDYPICCVFLDSYLSASRWVSAVLETEVIIFCYSTPTRQRLLLDNILSEKWVECAPRNL